MKKVLLFVCLSFFACTGKKKVSPQSERPELKKALAGFEVMDGFEIELIAAEPLIEDPVAMEVDEDGNLYVLEMPGYPLDLTKKGKLKKLIDTDKDGFPDKPIVFADHLTLPMGLMRWKKGILVADSPDIIYFEDTNGDQKADKREVVLTGFSLSNPQHNMNTPKFGVDNWIYVGHSGAINSFTYENIFGDKGKEIRFPNNPQASFLPQNGNGRNVRFKPDTYQIESLSGETQYGHTTDPWGRRFYTDNANHLFHEVLDARYVNANKDLVIAEAMEKIPDHGDACEIYPITENPNHQLLTDIGVVTSSCGITWYDGGAFGKDFEKATFIGEPVHNLVHADFIQSKGATFSGKRVLEKKEFLASKDPWFRPVFFYVGPDGALYVVDYYRQIVEHPEWMSDEVNKSGALYNGTKKGRIYRISKKGAAGMEWLQKLQLSAKTSEELVELLSNENGWFRKTAQRLLFERGDKRVAPSLKKLIASTNDFGQVAALWLLYDWGKITPEDLLNGLQSSHEGVRENALQITDRLWVNPVIQSNSNLQQVLATLAKDSSPRVRFQWLCSSAFISFSGINSLRAAVLKDDLGDSWAGIAGIAASKGSEEELLREISKSIGTETEGKIKFINHLSATLINKGNLDFLKIGFDENPSTDWWQAAMFNGLARYLEAFDQKIPLNESYKESLISQFLQTKEVNMRSSIIALLKQTGLPKNTYWLTQVRNLFEQTADNNSKKQCLSLLALSPTPALRMELLNYLNGSNAVLQQAAMDALPDELSSDELRKINQGYKNLSPPVKKAWIKRLLSKEAYVPILLQELKKKNFQRGDLSWPQVVDLMNYYDQGIRTQARSILAFAEDRKAVLQTYLPAVEMKGNASLGRKVFETNCTVCHQIKDLKGNDFGPNLNTLKSRNAHSIITEIINPNNSIADKYGQWDVVLKDGTRLQGIIVSENDQSIAIKQLGGIQQTLPKSTIQTKKLSKLSAMPNGLEANINVKQMADLLAFIKN